MRPIEQAIARRDASALLRAWLATGDGEPCEMTFDDPRVATAAGEWCASVLGDFEARAAWCRTVGQA